MNQKKKKNLSSGLHNRVKWKRTHDEYGFKANFEVFCDQCGEEEKMFVRVSELLLNKRNYCGRVRVEPTLMVMYKCLPCAAVKWFYIGEPYMDNDYWNEILTIRDNHLSWIPPPETWSEDARVHKRLKDLGYVGGDYVTEDVTEIEEK